MASEIAISSLIDSLSRWEIAGYFSTAAVVAGCAGESVHELTTWFHASPWWKDHGGKAAAFFLIAALAVEVPIQLKTNHISGLIIERMNRETAELRQRTAKAELELEQLRRGQSLRLETLLENRFADILAAKPHGKFRIWYVPDNEEAFFLATSMAGMFLGAGWTGPIPVPIPKLPSDETAILGNTLFTRASGGLISRSGIVIRCSKESDYRHESSPIGSLLKSFEKAGLPVLIMSGEIYSSVGLKDKIAESLEKDEALVVVGAKY